MYPPENGESMSDEERRKGQHLTREDRYEIQKGLREHRTFQEISEIIGCSPDTISKEIRKHRYHKVRDRKSYLYTKPNRCKYRDTCRRRDVCHKRKGHKCRIPCRECLRCNELCPDFVDAPCPIEKKAPYVCNNCPKSSRCLFDKYLYNADCAHREYLEELHESRRGVDMTRDEQPGKSADPERAADRTHHGQPQRGHSLQRTDTVPVHRHGDPDRKEPGHAPHSAVSEA